jgi:hypothetical protein
VGTRHTVACWRHALFCTWHLRRLCSPHGYGRTSLPFCAYTEDSCRGDSGTAPGSTPCFSISEQSELDGPKKPRKPITHPGDAAGKKWRADFHFRGQALCCTLSWPPLGAGMLDHQAEEAGSPGGGTGPCGSQASPAPAPAVS